MRTPNGSLWLVVGLATVFSTLAACLDDPVAAMPAVLQDCSSGFDAWETSPYVLPYPAGRMYRVTQGNCSKRVGAHGGKRRFAYDFDMAVGDPVIAARGGMIEVVIERWADIAGGNGQNNMVRINHGDGSFADYVHLSQDGAIVEVGMVTEQGDTIAYSGNSGFSAGPHLHFHVELYGTCTPTDPNTGEGGCQSAPVNFRNTAPNPNGLVTGRSYEADPE